MADDDELNVTMSTPSKKSSQLDDFFGHQGTPVQAIFSNNQDEEEDWKRFRAEALRSIFDTTGSSSSALTSSSLSSIRSFTVDQLPEKSESVHLPDRRDYQIENSVAKEKIENGLDALNAGYLNVPVGNTIAIRRNGKTLSKKKCKKFQDDMDKAWEEAGRPSAKEIFSDDETDKKFNEIWKPQAKLLLKGKKKQMKREKYKPYHEYVEEMEENDLEHKICRDHYYLWLNKRIDKGIITWKHPYFVLERDLIRQKRKLHTKTKFKAAVQNVQNYYKRFKNRHSTDNN